MERGGYQLARHALGSLFKLVFPPACPLCKKTLPGGATDIFCSACRAGIVPLPRAHCPRCLQPFRGVSHSGHLCGRCLQTPPAFSGVFAVGLYEQSLRRAVQSFKFNQHISLDRPLARLLDDHLVPPPAVDLIVPVPLHVRDLQKRSYNQSLLLARELARLRKYPLHETLLLKTRQTAAQHQLSARQREANLAGAFSLAERVDGLDVLLVDDVMTTGATVEHCSRVLLAGGAKQVSVVVIGRAA